MLAEKQVDFFIILYLMERIENITGRIMQAQYGDIPDGLGQFVVWSGVGNDDLGSLLYEVTALFEAVGEIEDSYLRGDVIFLFCHRSLTEDCFYFFLQSFVGCEKINRFHNIPPDFFYHRKIVKVCQ